MDQQTDDQLRGVGIHIGPEETRVSMDTEEGDLTNTESLSTALNITEDGLEIGGAAVDGDATVRPLPWYEVEEHDGDRMAHQAGLEHGTVSLRTFLQEARQQWFADVTGFDAEAESVSTPSVFLVPGAYSTKDAERVEQVASAAGFTDAEPLRSPLGTAVWAAHRFPDPGVVATVKIGQYWTDIALVRLDPSGPTVDVIARTSEPALGREQFDEALAEWILDQAGRDAGAPVQPTPAASDQVQKAAHNALETLAADDEHTLDFQHPGLTTTDGRPVTVSTTIDRSTVISAADDAVQQLQSTIQTLIEEAPVARSEIDHLLSVGEGTVPTPIRSVVESEFKRRNVVSDVDRLQTIPSRGAAMLAAHGSEAEIVSETTVADQIALEVAGPEGVTSIPLTTTASKAGEPLTTEVTTALDGQLQGLVRVSRRQPLTGEPIEETDLLVEKIPSGPAGEPSIELILSVDGDDLEAEAAVALGTETGAEPETEQGTDATIDLSHEEEFTPELDVTESPPVSASWLAKPGAQADPDVARRPTTEGSPFVERASSSSEVTMDDVSPRRIVEEAYKVRRDLWLRAKEGQGLEPSEIEALVRKFDSSLRRFDIEPIDPPHGREMDPTRHRAIDTEPADEPEGTILSVERPGLEVGDKIADPARVIIASDEQPAGEGRSSPSDRQRDHDPEADTQGEVEMSDEETVDGPMN